MVKQISFILLQKFLKPSFAYLLVLCKTKRLFPPQIHLPRSRVPWSTPTPTGRWPRSLRSVTWPKPCYGPTGSTGAPCSSEPTSGDGGSEGFGDFRW